MRLGSLWGTEIRLHVGVLLLLLFSCLLGGAPGLCLAFCLAAHEQGLGTVIMGIFDLEEAAALLEIPEGRELVALIPIGYPAESPTAPRRKTVEDLLSYQE